VQRELVRDFSSSNWPQLVKMSAKNDLVQQYNERTSSESLREYVCAVCSEKKLLKFMHPNLEPLAVFDCSLLQNGHLPNSVPHLLSSIPGMQDLILDPLGVYHKQDSEPLLRLCRSCRKDLMIKRQIPRCSLANDLYLGHVPEAL
jgi:hypothetical protein